MRDMTGGATLNLHWFMLENERSLFVGVAGVANSILSCRSAHLLRSSRAMHVVTIGTLNQPFVDTMMKGHLELGLLLQMAGVAKLRLFFY